MGCDVHAYVEYSSNGEHWRNLTDNAGSRNYRMFGIMAGVRCEDLKMFDPKGLPEGRLSYVTEGAHWLSIAPENHPEWKDLEGWTSEGSARRWVNSGCSVADMQDGVLKRVSNPDHHTHSWLSVVELQKCVDRYRELSDGQAPTEWVAILGAMKAIEDNGEMSRVVFWFDN